MKVVIAPDSFKGCLTALEVAEAIATGLTRIWTCADVYKVPMADGGEGMVAVIAYQREVNWHSAHVHDPLGRPISAQYITMPCEIGKRAVIEMASASGLTLLQLYERNPMQASTFGTGELILDAVNQGCDEIVLGLGGSATVDGGMGALAALGMRFLDSAGRQLSPSASALGVIDSIDRSSLDARLAQVRLLLACDVDNHLCGPKGAVRMYGPQKGVALQELEVLEFSMQHWASFFPVGVAEIAGSGAAGGIAAGLCAFLGARMCRGVDLVAELIGLDDILAGADLVITGEGCINSQTIHGKTPVGVALRAHCPVVALVGELGEGFEEVFKCNIAACWPIANGPCSLSEALREAQQNLIATGERLARTISLGGALVSPKN